MLKFLKAVFGWFKANVEALAAEPAYFEKMYADGYYGA